MMTVESDQRGETLTRLDTVEVSGRYWMPWSQYQKAEFSNDDP